MATKICPLTDKPIYASCAMCAGSSDHKAAECAKATADMERDDYNRLNTRKGRAAAGKKGR